MVDLISQFSITEIIVFIALLATAIKGALSFFDWGMERLGRHFRKQEQEIEQDEKINSILEAQKVIVEDLTELKNTVMILKESDRDSIKSFITKEHNYYVREQGWIDDYSMEILERRFHHYEKEGGNSFALKLMNELRKLPNKPPQ